MSDLRPDQLRDRDVINRDAIVARITGEFEVDIDRFEGKWRLLFIEPSNSKCVGHAKFIFVFDSFATIEAFLKRLSSKVIDIKRERIR
jgi:hypothetical protein